MWESLIISYWTSFVSLEDEKLRTCIYYAQHHDYNGISFSLLQPYGSAIFQTLLMLIAPICKMLFHKPMIFSTTTNYKTTYNAAGEHSNPYTVSKYYLSTLQNKPR